MRLVLALLVLFAFAQGASAASRPVVLELFTSQSCSSCPPADALMAEYARTRTDVLPLDFHVDYWNQLSWHDPYSSPAATDRQRRYASALGSDVYTPGLVVDGSEQVVGSDRAAVDAAIARAQARQADGPTLHLSRAPDGHLAIDIGPGTGQGMLTLVGYDRQHSTHIGAGENGGRILQEADIVRGWTRAATWNGTPLHLTAPVQAGELCAALLSDQAGHVIAVAQPVP